jgi:hypothetical protein
MVSDLASLGAAGVMGAMWLWERRMSRHRDKQLDDAHRRIGRDEGKFTLLADVVSRNTAAFVKFVQQQKEQSALLHHLLEEIHHGRIL